MCLLLSSSIPFASAIAAERVGLVIGNQLYFSVPLDTPEADAKSMAAQFRSAGYRVSRLVNLRQADFYQAVDRFFAEHANAKVIVFFYAGHAVQLNGKNFLVPVDADRNDPDILSRLFDIRHLMNKLTESRAETKIVILDACRDNLFSSHPSAASGLSELIAPPGTFVAFSTAPGATAEDGEGENSPYTAALVQSIFRPGVKIEDAFKEVRRRVRQETNGEQTPWESTSLVQDFSIAGGGTMVKTYAPSRSKVSGGGTPVLADSAEPIAARGAGDRSACSRILAKLSLGMEPLTENENQTLAGCRR
jgi:uncharacterized caspase-like protein